MPNIPLFVNSTNFLAYSLSYPPSLDEFLCLVEVFNVIFSIMISFMCYFFPLPYLEPITKIITLDAFTFLHRLNLPNSFPSFLLHICNLEMDMLKTKQNKKSPKNKKQKTNKPTDKQKTQWTGPIFHRFRASLSSVQLFHYVFLVIFFLLSFNIYFAVSPSSQTFNIHFLFFILS